MKKKALSLITIMLLIASLCLTGCGGSSPAKSGPSDEELIEAELKTQYDAVFNAENFNKLMEKELLGEEAASEESGVDFTNLSTAFLKHFYYDVEKTEVNGDEATVTVKLHVLDTDSDLFDKMGEEMEPAIEEKYKDADFANLDMNELYQFTFDFMADYINNNEVAETESEATVGFHKDDSGNWVMNEEDSFSVTDLGL